MRYLVTGGSGFIGSHLVAGLVARGDDVLILDDLSTGSLGNVADLLASPRVEFVEGSVTDAELIDDCMRQVDVCFHLAAAVGVQLVVAQPLDALHRNVRGTDVVVSAATRHSRRLVFTSTSEVYGKNGGPVQEDADGILGSPLKSRWAYAISKSLGEALAFGNHRERGTPVVVARLFSAVGPRQKGAYGMVLPRFIRQALAGEDLTVFGNGTQLRCFAHVSDVCQALMQLGDCDAATGRVFNIGSSEEIAIVELARRVIEASGTASTIKLVPYAEAYGEGFEELWRRRPDTAALQELVGWRTTRGIDEAIDDVIAYERHRAAAKEKGTLRIAG